MAIYAIVYNGVISNIIEWDGVTDWGQPSGTTIVPVPDGTCTSIGSTYSNGVFGEPPPLNKS